MRRRLILLPLALASLGLAACSTPAGQQQPDAAGTISVVASTNVYADIAERIGGDAVAVDAIIDRPAQDPHSYEATPQDKLAVSKAAVIVANGGGYDPFMETLTQDLGTGAALVSAVDLSAFAAEAAPEAGHGDEATQDSAEPEAGQPSDAHAGHDHGAFNEHVWYDLPTMEALANAIAQRLGEQKPDMAETFTANARAFNADAQRLEDRLAALRGPASGKQFAMTEPVPYYLLDAVGLVDATPEGFSEAIEEGSEVPPLVLKALNDELTDGSISLLAYNPQTASPQTESIRATAEEAAVPVLDFTETLPADTGYLSWMGANIDELARALKG